MQICQVNLVLQRDLLFLYKSQINLVNPASQQYEMHQLFVIKLKQDVAMNFQWGFHVYECVTILVCLN